MDNYPYFMRFDALARMLPPPSNPANTLQPQGAEWDNLPLSEKVQQVIAFADDMAETAD